MSPLGYLPGEDGVDSHSADAKTTINAEAHLQYIEETVSLFGSAFRDWMYDSR